MSDTLNRRSLLGAVVASGIAPAAALSQSEPQRKPAEALSVYQFGGCVWVRCGHRLVTCYRCDPTQKYPYFYPFTGPVSGLPLTSEAGTPYPHHRSILFACDRVNGHNFWQDGNERGQIVSTALRSELKGGRAIIRSRCHWQPAKSDPIIMDERTFQIYMAEANTQILDVSIRLETLTDITINKTNHSLFAVRAAHDLTPNGGGQLQNSSGAKGEKATFGQQADWCVYTANRCDNKEAVALFDHPNNPWRDRRWFTRDYGFISPTPFNWLDTDMRLSKGETVTLRYRVVGLAGRNIEQRLGELFDDFKVS